MYDRNMNDNYIYIHTQIYILQKKKIQLYTKIHMDVSLKSTIHYVCDL